MELNVSRSSAEAGSQSLNRTNSPNEFFIISKGDNLLVDARTLHDQLGIGYKMTEWLNVRVREYGFQEGQDYFSEISEKSTTIPS